MSLTLQPGKANFGTAPVFLTAIATILGAILFLRFGYSVGSVGFLGTLLIIAVGHMVTLPTAMAIAEIATNQKVEGGGEYYIISRSFGINIGAAIGIALYLSQAISVAFYIIAFAEAFEPLLRLAEPHLGFLPDKRVVSVPAAALITALILFRGAALGVKALYVVVATLFVSLALFFLGKTGYTTPLGHNALLNTVENADPWFRVFAICFPAFTGMTAGVGLSGDLRDPRRSIPLGTLAATLTGMVVYVFVAYKLSVSAAPSDLVGDQLIMSRIALWGPMIPIGLACATVSSAIGSYLVAPRTLQAIAADRVVPWAAVSGWLARGRGPIGEPYNASLVTAAIAFTFVAAGGVDFVAQIISMFFMVTYGSICMISFLEHFAGDPSYRPAFRSRWYVSLFGAVLCGWLMFQMSAFYAVFSALVMLALYVTINRYNRGRGGLSEIFRGAIFQLSRQLHVFVQKSSRQDEGRWRPSTVCISQSSFSRLAAFDLLRWISHRYGFGTYIHYIPGYLSHATREKARESLSRLVGLAEASDSNVYIDTLVSPSYTTAICQLIQIPGISGKENNMVLFEFSKDTPSELEDIVDNFQLVSSMGFDVAILASCERGFGYRRQIHVWLSTASYESASLMVVLAYILIGHADWKRAVIRIFSILPEDKLELEQERLHRLIRTGRLPISPKNVEVIPQQHGRPTRSIITERSRDADLVILGFHGDALRHEKSRLFDGYEELGNLLFVHTEREIDLVREEEIDTDVEAAPAEAETESATIATGQAVGKDEPPTRRPEDEGSAGA